MKKIFLFVFFLLLLKVTSVQAQTNDNTSQDTIMVTDVMPEYPGGNEEMARFIIKNIKYPEIAKENGIKGKVYVEFIVNREGYVTDVTIKRGIGGGCDEEAVRIIKKMPQWKPGSQNGKTVNVKMLLPINFILQ